MAMPSNSRLIRILQDHLVNRELESSDTKEAILNSFSDEQRQLMGEAMSIAWEEGYENGRTDEAESHQEI